MQRTQSPHKRPLYLRLLCALVFQYEVIACLADREKLPTITRLTARHHWLRWVIAAILAVDLGTAKP